MRNEISKPDPNDIPDNVLDAMETLCDELKLYPDDDAPDAKNEILDRLDQDFDLTEDQSQFVADNWSYYFW